MSGVEIVRQAVVQCLQAGGLRAEAAYSREMAAAYEETVIAVGVRSCGTAPAGFDSYLGERYDEKTASYQEQYGRRAELTIVLYAYAPRSVGAKGCGEALEAAHDLLTATAPAGLQVGEMDWGEVGVDRDTGMFLQQGSLRCSASFVAVVQEETGLLLSFRLKGVPLLEHDHT